MVALAKIQAAQIRAASHYLDKLHQINQAYLSGGENVPYALALFESEWQQIRSWHTWSATHDTPDDAINSLCAQYPVIGKDVLRVRLFIEERLNWYETSLTASMRLSDPELIAENLLSLAENYNLSGESQKAIDCARQVFDYYPEDERSLLVGRTYNAIAGAEMSRGDVQVAHAYFEKSLQIFAERRDILRIADVQYDLSVIAGRTGDYDTAIAYVEQALPVFERSGNLLQVGNCYNVLGLVALRRNQLKVGASTLRQSITYFEMIDYLPGISRSLANLATLLAMDEQFEEAEAVALKSLQLAQAAGAKRAITEAYVRLGRINAGRKHYDKAQQNLLQAIEVSEGLDHPYARVFCFYTLGYIALEEERLDEAISYLDRSLELSHSIKDTDMLTYGYANLCEAYRRQQKFQQALHALDGGLQSVTDEDFQAQVVILVNAVRLYVDMAVTEPAVRWLGILQQQHNLPYIESQLASLYEELSAAVKKEQFESWYREGQAMTVEAGLLALRTQVEAKLRP
ncbi:MAG: tetratricopeptide repeat protein [Anaerolineae bacterium]|nr:tetratricopeptide repeat protein [Anaerolineae bacterium]